MADVKKILIIDDEPVLQTMLKSVLGTHGFEVSSASTGEEGLLAVDRDKPDLILLDVMLPGIKGREVCRRLKAQDSTRHIPILFLTAKDSDDDVQAEMELGAEGHLTKPFNSPALVRQIKEIFAC